MTVLAERSRVPHSTRRRSPRRHPGRLRDVGKALGVTREKEDSARQRPCGTSPSGSTTTSNTTNRLIELHGLEGKAGRTC